MAEFPDLFAVAMVVLFGCWTSFKLGIRHERSRRRRLTGGGTYGIDIRSAYPKNK